MSSSYSNPPDWLAWNVSNTKKEILTVLKSRKLKTSFLDRRELNKYIQFLLWPWNFQWRQEQTDVLNFFFSHGFQEMAVQAVFGSGKTTMMLAIVHILVLKEICPPDHIYIFAFNVAIKNEIKKRLQCKGLSIKTYDSLIYTLCSEMGVSDLHLPNFEGKRRFVRENLNNITPLPHIRHVFIDEAQDLEKPCYSILRRRFPTATFLFVGDIFQSIQKEPRESLLWYLLQHSSPLRKIYTMKSTPRVPPPILAEIQTALTTFYPEFKDTIQKWSSTNTISSTSTIHWHPFTSYKQVYDDMLVFCKSHPPSECMILTFSSAITVRGSLGDVARVRKFLSTHGIQTNPNHKNMTHDQIFLSTANSSKGLERPHVFCFLTFPLEKAFSNFSDDLVVNIVTVALTRAKQSVHIYIPSHKDRFSTALTLYQKCPPPQLESNLPQRKKGPAPTHAEKQFVNIYDMKSMLEQEHGVTELLRQSIISFETKAYLKSFAKKYETKPLPSLRMESFQNEEGCAFVGILFESLILSSWTNQWPRGPFTENHLTQHDVFAHFSPMVDALRKKYLDFIKKPYSIGQLFPACILYARLQIACYQKLFICPNPKEEQVLLGKWMVLQSFIFSLKPPCNLNHLKVQSNVAMAYVSGIADALVLNNDKASKEPLEVIEIKASRAAEWKDNALVQSVLYGLMLGRNYFRIHLVNVLQKESSHYCLQLKGEVLKIRRLVQVDVAQWNLNCFLAKNISHHDPDKKTWKTEGMFFLEGINNEYVLIEMTSPTRARILSYDLPWSEIKLKLEQLIKGEQMSQLVIGRHVEEDFSFLSIDFKKLEFPANFYSQNKSQQWETFLRTQVTDWKETEESKNNKTRLSWSDPLATLSVQICHLAKNNNFV